MTAEQKPAPFVRRWLATAIDMILCSFIFIAWGAFFKIGVVLLTGQDISKILSYSTGDAYDNPTLFFAFLPAAVSIWYYHARMEASAKMATIGKRVAGLCVVTKEGQRMAVIQSTWRFCIKILLAVLSVFLLGPLIGFGEMVPSHLRPPYVVFAVLLFTAFFPASFTRTKRPLHDMLSGSFVILNRSV